MATIRERFNQSGKTTFAVLFRHSGRQPSVTFTTRSAAERFVKTLDVIGPDKALAVASSAPRARESLDELAERFFTLKATRVRSDRTAADYRRDYLNWISPALGHRSAESITEVDVQQLIDDVATQPRHPRAS